MYGLFFWWSRRGGNRTDVADVGSSKRSLLPRDRVAWTHLDQSRRSLGMCRDMWDLSSTIRLSDLDISRRYWAISVLQKRKSSRGDLELVTLSACARSTTLEWMLSTANLLTYLYVNFASDLLTGTIESLDQNH